MGKKSRASIHKRALHAAHAVTMGAIMMAGCVEEPQGKAPTPIDPEPGEWDLGSVGDDGPAFDQSSPVIDQGSGVDDMPPTPVDMSQIDLGHMEPDQNSALDMGAAPDLSTPPDMSDAPDLPPDMTTAPDMETIEDMGPDLPPEMCDGTSSDMVCPAICSADEDVDCCTAQSNPSLECAISANGVCECEPLPRCSDIADNQCPAHCDNSNDADCCAAMSNTDQSCSLSMGACSCEVTNKCSHTPDGECPMGCTGFGGPMDPNVDADCCTMMAGCSFSAGYCGCAVPGPFTPPVMPIAA